MFTTHTVFRYLAVGFIAAVASMANAGSTDQEKTATLTLKVFNNPDPKGFQVSSTLVMGEKEAILLDAQFTQSNAHRVVADVLESGKTLTTVFITEGDPDYYFGLNIIKQAFPNAKVLTTAAVAQHIQETLAQKLQVWGPQLGANGPSSIVRPEILTESVLELEGNALHINHGVGAKKDKIFIWIPSIKTVVGGVLVFGDLHLWTAYPNPTKKMRQDWIASLERIAAFKPDLVIPGHFKSGAPQTVASVNFTRDYLITYEKEVAKAKNSEDLIKAMKKHYPNAGLGIALEIGAKVTKGEMQWEKK